MDCRQNSPKFLHNIFMIFLIAFGLITLISSGGGDDGGDDNAQEETLTGNAILDIQILDGGMLSSTPPAAPEGFSLLNYDINEGSGKIMSGYITRQGRLTARKECP